MTDLKNLYPARVANNLAQSAAEIVTPAAIFGSVITCGLWCLAGVYAERKLLPAAYRMRPALAVLVVLSGLFLTGLGIAAAGQYFDKLFTAG